MATLSKVSDVTRKIAEIIAIGIGGIILLFVIFKIGVFLKELIAPTPAPAPTVAFGKLPMLSFPLTADTTTYSYTINTLSGFLPTLPDRVTVYKFSQQSPNLLGLDKAKKIVAGAGFLEDPIALSDVSYQWTKTDPFLTTFTMDIQNFDFTMTSQYKTDPTVTSAANIPDETLAKTVSGGFFDKVMPLPSSVDDNTTKTTLLGISNNTLVPATSLSNTQIIRIDYFSKPIDTIPLLTANPNESLIYSLVASGTTDFPQVVEAQYYHKDVSNTKATYPIKTAQQAFDDLKNGNGYIAANPTGDTNITITDVHLGYYVDASPQDYLWPIIVFQGDKGFYAYVSALSDAWIKK